MIRTTVVGSWPPAAEFTPALAAYHQGQLAADETEALLRQVARQAIAEQCLCGLHEYTGGETSADTFMTIQGLAGVIDRVVLEFSLPEQWAERALLAQIPQSMEVAAGIIDVKSPTIETAADAAAKIQELLRYVPAERLLICPSCGLGRREPALAIGKAQVMVQAVQTINQTMQV